MRIRASREGKKCRKAQKKEGTTQKQKMGRSLFERLYKKSYFKACEGYKTATDAACESRECLHSMQSCEEEKPHLWVNLLEVNAIAYEQCLRQREL